MPYLIKSSEGKRSCTLIGSKKSDNSIKNDLIEALRGLSFHIEVKITDVTHGQQESETSQQRAHIEQSLNQPASISSKPSSELLTDPEECRPPLVKVEPENQANKVLLPSQNNVPNDKPIVALQEAQPKIKAPLAFAPMQVLRKQVERSTPSQGANCPSTSNVSSVYYLPKKTDQSTVIIDCAPPSPPPPVVTPELQASRETSMKSVKIDKAKMMEIKAKIDQEQQQPTLPLLKFNRGKLKVGSTIETIYLEDDKKIDSAVFVSYDITKVIEIAQIFANIMDELDEAPKLSQIKVGDIVAAKSVEAGDDSWSRAIVSDIMASDVEIYFLDWGVSETLDRSRLRALSHAGLSIELVPALAVKVQIENMPDEVKEGNEFLLQVNSYDDFEEMYKGKFIDFKN